MNDNAGTGLGMIQGQPTKFISEIRRHYSKTRPSRSSWFGAAPGRGASSTGRLSPRLSASQRDAQWPYVSRFSANGNLPQRHRPPGPARTSIRLNALVTRIVVLLVEPLIINQPAACAEGRRRVAQTSARLARTFCAAKDPQTRANRDPSGRSFTTKPRETRFERVR